MTLIDAGFVPPSLAPRRAAPDVADLRFRDAMREATANPETKREPVKVRDERDRGDEQRREDEDDTGDERRSDATPLVLDHSAALLQWGSAHTGTTRAVDASEAPALEADAFAEPGWKPIARVEADGELTATAGERKAMKRAAGGVAPDVAEHGAPAKPGKSAADALASSRVEKGAPSKAQAVSKLLQEAAPATLQSQLGQLDRAVRLSLPVAATPTAPVRATGERLLELRGSDARDVSAVSAAMAGARGQTVTSTTTAAAVGATPKASAVDAWWPEMRVRLLNDGGDATIELELDNGRRVRLQLEVRDGTMSAHVSGAEASRDPDARRLLEVVKSIANATGLDTGSFTSGEDRDSSQEGRRDEGLRGPGSTHERRASAQPLAPTEHIVRSGLVDLIV
jgi:hypothetical protein